MTIFNGNRLVLGEGKTVGGKTFEVDLKTNRNAKMIETLSGEDVNGVFLFYLVKNEGIMGKGFQMPPGLSDKDASSFQKKFLALLEKYAGIANKKVGVKK